MTTLTLYGNVGYTSPYVLSVFVALEEKQLPFELRLVNLEQGEHRLPRYRELSLTNRVPTLVHDGFALSESTAITEYLDERFLPPEHPRLYPQDVQARARVRMVQSLIRSDFMPLREERSTDTFFGSQPCRPLSPVALLAAERLLWIAGQLVSGPSYLVSQFSLADVDLATMLQRLIQNGDQVPQPLVDYANFVWERPSVRKWLACTEIGRRRL